jgi:hypothetical protein
MQKNIAKSLNKDANLAVQEIGEQFSKLDNIRCIIFFASYLYNSDELASAMNQRFSGIECFGSSSGREISTEGISEHSITAFAFTSDLILDCHIEVIEHLSTCSTDDVQVHLKRFAEHYNSSLFILEPSKYFGLVFMDFNSKAEEKLFNELGDSTQVVFMGATASDYWQFKDTGVYAKGRYYKNAAVISLFKPAVKFGFEKMESVYEISTPKMVTRSDMNNKILYEIDGRPAAEVYCEATGLDYETIEKGKLTPDILSHPLGIEIDGQRFLRDVFFINDVDRSLQMVCNIPEGLLTHFYKIGDIIEDTQIQLIDLRKKYNDNIGCLFTFTCSNRHQDIISTSNSSKYENMFSDITKVGFCTYGEYYTVPVNHTSTFLVLLEEKI